MATSGIAAAARRLPLLMLFIAVFMDSSLVVTPGNRVEAVAGGGGDRRRVCAYMVKVKTSCVSPVQTADVVSVAFGNTYINVAYGARLSGPPGTFERCSADTFRVSDNCADGLCYLFLHRAGRSGWAPEWVQVFEPGAAVGENPATFYFGAPLPNGVWHGPNRCPRAAAAGTTAPQTNTSALPLGR